MMRKLIIFCLVAGLFVSFVVAPASGQPIEDHFGITLDGINNFIDGYGSGFSDGTGQGQDHNWYYYQNTGWYNQWFYNAPPDPDRWKEITYDILIESLGMTGVTIALNWSTLAYPGGPPPLPGLLVPSEIEDIWIHREVIYEGLVPGVMPIAGEYIIPDYNPEWVSIDVRAWIGDIAFVSGDITHECIPAPGAIVLGSIGIGLVGWLRRRRTL